MKKTYTLCHCLTEWANFWFFQNKNVKFQNLNIFNVSQICHSLDGMEFLLTKEGHVYVKNVKNDGFLSKTKDETKNFSRVFFFNSIPIRQIQCNYSHCLFLTCGGQVYSCGNNEWGQLVYDIFYYLHEKGLGGTKFENVINLDIPQLVPLKNIKKIEIGHNCSFLQSESGKWYSFGSNYKCQMVLSLKNS